MKMKINATDGLSCRAWKDAFQVHIILFDQGILENW